MHQALSGHFSPQMSHETGRCERAPSAGHRPRTLTSSWGAAVLCPAGKHHWVWAFSPTIIHHEIPFVMSSAELSSLMMLSLSLCLASWKKQCGVATFSKCSLIVRPLKGFFLHPCSAPVYGFWLCKVNSLIPWQWCTAVRAKLLFLLTDRPP